MSDKTTQSQSTSPRSTALPSSTSLSTSPPSQTSPRGAQPKPHVATKKTTPPASRPNSLMSLRSPPDLTLGGVPKPEFAPIIPTGRIKKPSEDIDSKLPGTLTALMEHKDLKRSANMRGSYQNFNKSGGRGRQFSSSMLSGANIAPTFSPSSSAKSLLRAQELEAASYKKQKEEEEEQSDQLSRPDIDPWNPAHPLSLPLYDPRTSLAISNKPEEQATFERRPSRLALHYADGMLMNDDQLLFIQLPSNLPIKQSVTPSPAPETPKQPAVPNTPSTPATPVQPPPPTPTATSSALQVDAASNVPPTALSELDGFLGKLQVYESGRMVLMMGDVPFEVRTASQPTFLEEVYAFEGKSCYRLGEVSQRVLISPDVETCLSPEVPTSDTTIKT